MTQSYNIHAESQVKQGFYSQSFPYQPQFSKLSPPQTFLDDPIRFIRSHAPSIALVLEYLVRFRKCRRIAMKNATIAKATGLSLATIKRCTAVLQGANLIMKHQAFRGAMNEYWLHPVLKKGAAAFLLWINSLTPQQLYDFDQTGILPGGKFALQRLCVYNEPPNINKVNNRCLFSKFIRNRESDYDKPTHDINRKSNFRSIGGFISNALSTTMHITKNVFIPKRSHLHRAQTHKRPLKRTVLAIQSDISKWEQVLYHFENVASTYSSASINMAKNKIKWYNEELKQFIAQREQL